MNVVTRFSPNASPQLSHCFSSTITARSPLEESRPQIKQSSRRDVCGSWNSRITPWSVSEVAWNTWHSARNELRQALISERGGR